MKNTSFVFFLKVGFFFGFGFLKLLEWLIPPLRDKKQNLHGFSDHYLRKYNLTNMENFKRLMKLNFAISLGLIFWVYFIILSYYLSFDFAFQLRVLAILGMFFVFFMMASASWNYNECFRN